MAFITGVSSAFPPHYYSQQEILAWLQREWGACVDSNLLQRLHRSAQVQGRYLSLPIEAYAGLSGFGAHNAAWIEAAVALGEEAVRKLLAGAGLDPAEISMLVFTTVTGIAVPSIDARLMNRIEFPAHLKRVPLFGLGCLAGVAGVARVADYLKGHPDEAAILLSVELCSLTFQLDDSSGANVVSTALFGDGAAAVLMVGPNHRLAASGKPRVLDSRSLFFHGTERVMGWDVVDSGFKIVLGIGVSDVARTRLRHCADAFLAGHGLTLDDIAFWVTHPGGPKVIQGVEEGLGLTNGALQLSRESLSRVGNLSSASVLCVLEDTLRDRPPAPGSFGLMLALGPGFCAELVLLRM